jgi:hypothetical protein
MALPERAENGLANIKQSFLLGGVLTLKGRA